MKEEMSRFIENMPRYQKGYDIDQLVQRYLDDEEMTDEEDDIIDEILQKYCGCPANPKRSDATGSYAKMVAALSADIDATE